MKFQKHEAKEIIFISIIQLVYFVTQMQKFKYTNEGMRKWELSYTVGGSVNWNNYFEGHLVNS